MTLLSAPNFPLPDLYLLSAALSAEAQARLETALIPKFDATISAYFWSLTARLESMLKAVPFVNMQRPGCEEAREQVLESVKSVMHDIAALTEYLGDALAVVLPTQGKKSRAASHAKEKLYAEADRLFKLPINLIKHERFQLRWLEQYNLSELTAGYYLTGMVGPGANGPASRRFPVSEGYSFALMLRSVLPTVYRLCGHAEQALKSANLFGETAREALSLDQTKLDRLTRVLVALSALPQRGFPNEKGIRVMQLEMQGNTVCVGVTFQLVGFKTRYHTSAEVGPAVKGETFYIPYWVRSGV